MLRKRILSLLCAAALALPTFGTMTASAAGDEEHNGDAVTRQLDVITDMVHNNPGQKPYDSAYNDPAVLTQRGLTGKVFFLYDAAQFGLDWKDYDPDILPDGSTELQWARDKKAALTEKYAAAKAAGQKVYFMMDMIVFPERVKTLYGDEILTNGKIDIHKEKTQEMLRYMLSAMCEQFEFDGIYVRTGETYVGGMYGSEPGNSAPYHFGNNPVGVGGDSTSAHLLLLEILRDELCVKEGREVIYRTWGFDDFQKTEEGYLKISDQIEPHDKLYFAIKYTSGDFWRNYEFNQSLNSGKHKQIVEIQCAREYEGKGAYPNYIGDGVINGFEEYAWQMEEGEKQNLRDVINVEGSKVVGVWTWSRGGGWGGPYTNGTENPEGGELWSDLNAYVVQTWAQDTSRTDKSLVLQYAREELGMNDADAARFYEIAIKSADAVLRGIGTNSAPTLQVLWTRDASVNQSLFNQNITTIYNGRQNGVYPKLEERREAVQLWKEMLALAEAIDDGVEQKNYIVTTTKYGLLLFSLFERMHTAGILYTEMQKENVNNVAALQAARADFDRLWAEWEALKASDPACPTLYTKSDFLNVMNQYRYELTAPAKVAVAAGETTSLTISVAPYSVSELTFTSSDPSIAAVDKNGAVTGVKDGLALVTVSTEDGLLRTATVVQVGGASGNIVHYEEDFETGYPLDENLNWPKTSEDERTNVKVTVKDGRQCLKLEQQSMFGTPATVFHTVKAFDKPLTGVITVSLDMLTENKNSAFFCVYDADGKFITQVDYRGDGIYVDIGGQVKKISDLPYNANEWYHIDIVCDTDARRFTISVNGTDPRTFDFREEAQNVGLLKVGVNRNYGNNAYYDNLRVTEQAEPELTAAEVAGLLKALESPHASDPVLTLPAVPAGFTVAVKSSTPNVIAADGTLQLSGAAQEVSVILTVTRVEDGTTADTAALAVTLPAAATKADLTALIEELEQKYTDDALAQYTDATVQTYREALEAARSLLRKDDATARQIALAMETLQNAADALTAITPSEPTDPVTPPTGAPAALLPALATLCAGTGLLVSRRRRAA